tara:strand:- start:172621 stop:172944 length:324 start_codon:yes stop_codon:yes gene_type:complete
VIGSLKGEAVREIKPYLVTKFEQALIVMPDVTDKPSFDSADIYILKLVSGETYYIPEICIDPDTVTEIGGNHYELRIADCSESDRKTIKNLLGHLGKRIVSEEIINT